MSDGSLSPSQFASLLNMVTAALGATENYDERVVARDAVDDLVVSTAFTTDMGFETAILDAEGVTPVERYETREAAQGGHQRWLKKIVGLNTVERLGYADLSSPTPRKLKRPYLG